MLCRYTETDFCGEPMYLAYTVNAMFQVNDMLTADEEIMDLFSGKNEEGLRRFCEAVSILARCGAQVRKLEGFPPPAAPTAEEMFVCIAPAEFIKLKRKAINAIILGYGQEIVDEEEEIDVELANMEKKADPPERPS